MESAGHHSPKKESYSLKCVVEPSVSKYLMSLCYAHCTCTAGVAGSCFRAQFELTVSTEVTHMTTSNTVPSPYSRRESIPSFSVVTYLCYTWKGLRAASKPPPDKAQHILTAMYVKGSMIWDVNNA